MQQIMIVMNENTAQKKLALCFMRFYATSGTVFN